MQYKETNLNYYIKVKLTEKGKEIYRNRFDEDDIKELGIEYCEPTVDEEGYTEFQMWDFARIFGNHMNMIGPMVCETNVMVKVDDYKPVWHYIKDKLPPEPNSNDDGFSIKPLDYVCAYECGNDGCNGIDYECDVFTYLGNGEWLGENKRNYPIYAWMEYNVEVPKPIEEESE